MPLTRYQIRNEYSLADPELYRAADRDDPEALLEGVAMAGLIGVLRQLGDLAEFAAEIFHDLHEEVMATAARGHGVMVRVQQLEAEFPSIEKAFLSQTSHSPFLYTAGIEWHPNLQMNQNMITRGDLPRFLMDSYEECRGPPRLFLLDKFDIAGAGACLKRYSDPSLFKAGVASSGRTQAEVQREKKARKIKKKGSRWRNGETPEVFPTSHDTLHQLFSEECSNTSNNTPVHVVRLKKRQFKGSCVDSRTGKSYMEKFLEACSPECKVISENYENPPCSEMRSSNNCESSLEINEIRAGSLADKPLPKESSPGASPDKQEMLLEASINEGGQDIVDDGSLEKLPEPNPNGELEKVLLNFRNAENYRKTAADGESKTEANEEGYQSDGITSEMDNYVDALATMESEGETDIECRPKKKQGFLDYGTNEGHQELRSSSLYSHSIGNSSVSDDEKISLKKVKSSISSCDTPRNFAEKEPSDGDVVAKVDSSNKVHLVESFDLLSDEISRNSYDTGTNSPQDMISSGTCNEVPFYKFDAREGGLNLAVDVNGITCVSGIPLQNKDDVSLADYDERQPVSQLDGGIHDISSEFLVHLSINPDMAVDRENYDKDLDEVPPDRSVEDFSMENIERRKLDPRSSVTLDDPIHSVLGQELEVCSDIRSPRKSLPALMTPCDLDVVKPASMVAETANVIVASEMESEHLMTTTDTAESGNFAEQEFQELMDEVLLVDSATPHDQDVVKPDSIIADTANVMPASEPASEHLTTTIASPQSGDFTKQELQELMDEVSLLESPHKRFPASATTCDPDVVKPVNVVSETANVMPASEMVSENLTTTIDTRWSGDFAEREFQEPITDDVSLRESVLENFCTLWSEEKPLYKSQEEGMDISDYERKCGFNPEEVQMSLGSVGGDTPSLGSPHTSVKPSSVIDNHLLFDDSEIQTIQTRSDDGKTAMSPVPHHSSSQFQEDRNFSSVESDRDKLVTESSCPDYHIESDLQKEVNQLTVVPMGVDGTFCNPRSCKFSSSGLAVPVHDPSLHELTEKDLHVSGTATPTSSKNNQDGESTFPNLIHPLEAAEDCISSSTSVLSKPGPSLFMESQGLKLNVESLNDDGQNLKSSVLQFEQTQVSNEMNQDGCFEFDSYIKSCPMDPFCQSSESEFSKLLATNNAESFEPAMKSPPNRTELNFTLPVPNTPQTNVDELPPLPPLPPIQWRIGKLQHGSSASEREMRQHTVNPFSPPQPVQADNMAKQEFPALGVPAQPVNPFLLSSAMENEEPQRGSGALEGGTLQCSQSPFLSQVLCLDEEITHHGLLPSEEKEAKPINPFFSLPATDDETNKHGSCNSGQKKGQPSLNPFVPISITQYVSPRHVSLSLEGKTEKASLAMKPGLHEEMLQLTSADSDGEMVNPPNSFESQPGKNVDQPVQGSQNLQGEIKWMLRPASEEEKPNGSYQMRHPRPKDPLIEAVASHDKSTLRKVTQKVWSIAGREAKERDSLLEQIRTKSFNLKPAAATRPSTQAPKTNLKVAAILEKATAIRQVLAGSDEDDDEDSWSAS